MKSIRVCRSPNRGMKDSNSIGSMITKPTPKWTDQNATRTSQMFRTAFSAKSVTTWATKYTRVTNAKMKQKIFTIRDKRRKTQEGGGGWGLNAELAPRTQTDPSYSWGLGGTLVE